MSKAELNSGTSLAAVEMRKAFLRSSPLTAAVANAGDLLMEMLSHHCTASERQNMRARTKINMHWLAEGNALIKISLRPKEKGGDVDNIHYKTFSRFFENLKEYENEGTSMVWDENLPNENEFYEILLHIESEELMEQALSEFTQDYVRDNRDYFSIEDSKRLGGFVYRAKKAASAMSNSSLTIH